MKEQQTTRKTFTLEHLKEVVSKKKGAVLSVQELETVFLGIQPDGDKEILYHITKVFTYQLKQEKVNAFYIIKIFLTRVFVHYDSMYLNMFRNLLKEIHCIKFTLPSSENSIDFEPNSAQLSWFFEDEKAFINGYINYLLTADPSLLSWLHYYFWEPFEECWFGLLKRNKAQRKNAIRSWLHITENVTLESTYRNYGIYALCVLKPLMSFWERKRTDRVLRKVTFEEQCMQSALLAWEEM